MQTEARYAKITARTSCSTCGQPVPLTTLTEQASCPYCGAPNEVAREIWESIVAEADEASDSDSSKEGTHLEGAREVVYTVEAGVPRCEACNRPFPLDDLAVGVSRNYACTSCGDPASTEPVPEWLSIDPAKQLYSVDPKDALAGGAALSALQKAIKPIVMSCPRCGGGLEVTTSSERLLGCRFCNADVYLPDEIWRRLHPIKRVQPFYLRFEGPSLERRRRERDERKALAREERKQREALAHEERKQRNRAETARARAAEDARRTSHVRAAKRVGWWAAIGLTLLLSAAGAASWAMVGRPIAVTIQIAAAVVLLAAVGVTTWLVSRPIRLASGNPTEWMIFVTWFWIPFALLMPIAGQIMALVRVVILARGNLGASTIQSNGNSRSYDAVELDRGESRPAALMFLALATLWPATMLPLLSPQTAADLLGVALK